MTNEYKTFNNYLSGKNNYNHHSKLDYWDRQAKYERTLLATIERTQRIRELDLKIARAEAGQRKHAAIAIEQQPKVAEAYTSTLTSRQQRSVRQVTWPQLRNRSNNGLFGGAMLGFVGDLTLVPLTVPAGHSAVEAAYWCVTIGPMLAGVTLPFVHERVRNLPRFRSRRTALLESEARSLGEWLKARYGLELVPENLSALAKAVAAGTLGVEYFTARDGVEYTFCHTTEGTWMVLGPSARSVESKPVLTGEKTRTVEKSEPLALPKASPPAASRPEVFCGEAALLHTRLTELAALLDAQRLSIEQQHVVSRVRQDVATLASTLARLANLGDAQVGQERAAAVMGQLVEELNELLIGEQAALLRELDVQQAYVRERRLPIGSGRLVLPAQPADEAGEGARE